MDGVSDRDYETHVTKYHVNQISRGPEQWSVFSAAQNLPAVLNDPSRGKQLNLFTKKWGDSFVEKVHIPASNYLVDITYEHLEPYMKKIGKRYRRHIRLSQTGLVDPIAGQQQQSPSQLSSHPKVYNELTDATINDIPQIFIKETLELNNPITFAEVFPGISASQHERQQSGRILQEKLSHYLDIVEVQIAKQVSQKSSAFFHAMTSQDAIMEEMQKATENVKVLRDKIQHLDATLARQSLQILSTERLRSRKHCIVDKLRLMASVHQCQPMIQLQLGTQDYVAALDLICTTKEIVAQELIGIHCFKHLPSQLTEIELLIDKMLTTDFEKYSTADLNRPLTSDVDERVVDEDKLIAIISGLLRKKNFSFVDTYKEEAIVTIKALVKQMLIEVIASCEAEICLTGAGEEGQTLTISEWIALLETATVTLLRLVRRIKSVVDVMVHVTEASFGKVNGHTDDFLDAEAFLSEVDYQKVAGKLKEMMHSVCNYCHERCANLISSQSLEKNTATADQLEKLADVVERFADGCERVCGLRCVPLMAALKSQGTRYAQKFHGDRKTKLALLLDSERWKQADVPAEFQKMIDAIAKGDFSSAIGKRGHASMENGDAPAKASHVLLVDAEPYALVGAALILVQIVSEYCRCASQLPIISIQLSRHVVDLLRIYNSRCCQLVLGAGALRVAGLTTITSGNLALVSRALQLVLWLLPHVKRHFQKFDCNGATATTFVGYDSVEKDFVGHIDEIEDKVLTIVCSLVHKQLLSWNARPPVPSQAFRNISRHLVKLHEAIAVILPEHQVNGIYRTMHRTFKDKLREALLKNNIINNGGPQHGIVTSELTFYLETLRTLNVLSADDFLDDAMNDIWLK